MAVSTSYAPLVFSGNDSATAFSVTWPFFTGSLVVTAIDSTGLETVKTITTHYTVSGGTDANGLPATGTVTMLTAPATGTQLRITRATAKTQAAVYNNNDAFPAKTHEAALDKLTLLVQEGVAGAVDEITGDFMQLNAAGATDFWDAEDTIIRNVLTPQDDDDAATKEYVDGQVALATIGSADFTQAGAGAIARTWQSKMRDVVSSADFSTLQQAFTAAAGKTLVVAPGDYEQTSTLIVPANITVHLWGVRIYDTSTHRVLMSFSGAATLYGGTIEGAGGTYNAAGYGASVAGTRNGAGVAPTMFEGPLIWHDPTFKNLGNYGFHAQFAKNIYLHNPKFSDVAYGSAFGYSCEDMHVFNPTIDGMSGETTSGELNAYGVSFTSLSGTADFVRDPRSVRCSVRGGTIKDVQTWHALDTHGGDQIVFDDIDIIDCAVAAVFTHLTTAATTNSTMSNLRIRNSLTGDNPSGFPKSGSAIWSFGSPTSQAFGNTIKDITTTGHGDPTASEGAIQIEYESDGACQNITMIEPHSCAISFNGSMRNYSLSHSTIVDPKNIGVSEGGATDSPQYVRFLEGGTYDKVTLAQNAFIRRRTDADNFVGVLGILVANIDAKDIRFYDNIFDGVLTRYQIPDLTGITFADSQQKGEDVASASTINLNEVTGDLIDVTGTTAITAVTLAEGRERVLRFTGALTFTHGASLVLPGAANITTVAGDIAVVRGYASGVVRCVSYTKVSGKPVIANAYSEITSRPQTAAGSLATAFTTTSSTDTSTGLTAAITPRSSSSQILVSAALILGADFWNTTPLVTVYRNGSQVWPANGSTKAQYKWLADTENNTDFIVASVAITFLDSPASASAQTYVVRLASSNNTNEVHLNRDNNASNLRGESNIVLEEII